MHMPQRYLDGIGFHRFQLSGSHCSSLLIGIAGKFVNN
jgi:hypothetical protein